MMAEASVLAAPAQTVHLFNWSMVHVSNANLCLEFSFSSTVETRHLYFCLDCFLSVLIIILFTFD